MATLTGGWLPNAGLALLSLGTLLVGLLLLWRPGEAPILLFIFCYQWMQASGAVFHSNWLGQDIRYYSRLGGEPALAVVLTFGALIALAIGMRIGWGAPRSSAEMRKAALSVSVGKWFALYVVMAGMAFLALALAVAFPGLSQLLLAFGSLKWAFFFMLSYVTFMRGRADRRYFCFAFLLEIAQGLGGYFSDFKTVIFMSVLAIVASGIRFSARTLAAVGVFSIIGLTLGILWTAVKGDYRAYVSGGAKDQIVTVDYLESIEKLYALAGHVDENAIAIATDNFLRRLSFTEFFAVVLVTVPRSVPYQDGAIWADAVSRPFMPRILFPEKTPISDTDRANAFTGGLAGSSEGTSISMGYPAESYIDFGPIGMMVPVFIFGLLCGQIQKRFVTWGASRGLLGQALASAVLFNAYDLGASITKTLGGVAVSLIVAVLFACLAARLPWLQKTRVVAAPSAPAPRARAPA